MFIRYLMIDFPPEIPEQSLHQSNTIFFDCIASTLNQFLDYEVTPHGKMILTLREHHMIIYTSLKELRNIISQAENMQMIIEYDSENKHILAIHDYYFARASESTGYSVKMDNLYFHAGKYSESPLNRKRLIDSIAYGLLAEIAAHNPADPNHYTRGLLLADYLYKNHPKESYKIIRKIPMTIQEQALCFFKNEKQITHHIKSWMTPLPQVNFSDFDREVFIEIMQYYGTFELVGPLIEKLIPLASAVLEKNKEILNLPEIILKKTEHSNDFNGYSNIFEDTKKRVAKIGKGTVLHQTGYFYKSYDPVVPDGVDVKVLNEYYHQGLAILQCLYRQIAIKLKIDPEKLSNYSDDKQSVLSLKRYPQTDKDAMGIQAHSDYGLLTLVVSDQPGLEVEQDGKWIAAPHEPRLRFFVNVGDWLLFQLNNTSFKPGMHRVPVIGKERYSAMVFLLPPNEEKLHTPKGKVATFREFLFSDKSAYMGKEGVDNTDPTLHSYIPNISKN